jgi:hypothetical protein
MSWPRRATPMTSAQTFALKVPRVAVLLFIKPCGECANVAARILQVLGTRA